MKNELKAAVAECERQIRLAVESADTAKEIEFRGRKAALYMFMLDWSTASTELRTIAEMVKGHNETHIEAQSQFVLGQALANIPEQRAEAEGALRQAVALYQQSGDTGREGEALLKLATLYTDDDYAAAFALLNTGIARFEAIDVAPETLLPLYRFRANCRMQVVDFAGALADMDRVEALAQGIDDEPLAMAIKTQRAVIEELANGDDAPESLARLFASVDAEQTPEEKQLQKALTALKAKRPKSALRKAEAVLEKARQATGLRRYSNYLMASLLIAEAQDALNNRVGVLVALLRCKVFLETEVGESVTPYINKVLDRLGDRWGQAGLQEAVREYQRFSAETGPIQV